ncbi:MAG: 16S rRNA (cytosine(1402)-N(4))-methyltransferase RsmH [Candidatus Bipolaricaulota bacterium]|nr:16S rRNA (cytosine(1402)-N(4))-methyltransferase RsmH [Candidatus Bipolaricaulota bacterium]
MSIEETDYRAIHQPVLMRQMVKLLSPRPGATIVDGTIGMGGHSEALLAAYPTIKIIGIDRDEEALSIAKKRLAPFGNRVRLVHGNYRGCVDILGILGIEKIDGFLLDLGLSSLQLDRPERGFSFRTSGPLDMRMDRTQGISAADLVNDAVAEELSGIIFRYGEERFARRVARAIVTARAKGKIETTDKLARIVYDAIPRKFHPPRIHPATRTFQALRIAVNDELDNLEKGLEAGFSVLSPRGVMAAMSFHSLEDRIVKGFFRYKALSCICPPDLPVCMCDKKVEMEVLTKKPILPSPDEIAKNPRARSAKMRAARKLDVSA